MTLSYFGQVSQSKVFETAVPAAGAAKKEKTSKLYSHLFILEILCYTDAATLEPLSFPIIHNSMEWPIAG